MYRGAGRNAKVKQKATRVEKVEGNKIRRNNSNAAVLYMDGDSEGQL